MFWLLCYSLLQKLKHQDSNQRFSSCWIQYILKVRTWSGSSFACQICYARLQEVDSIIYATMHFQIVVLWSSQKTTITCIHAGKNIAICYNRKYWCRSVAYAPKSLWGRVTHYSSKLYWLKHKLYTCSITDRLQQEMFWQEKGEWKSL